MRAHVAFGVVVFAALGLWAPAWASGAATLGQPAAQITSALSETHPQTAVRTAPPLMAVAFTAPAAQLSATGPDAGQPTTITPQRQETSPDGSSDRSDMAMMLLVALAMLTTVVFKGSRV